MDLDPKKLMFCLMTAVSENEALSKDLLSLFTLLKGAGEMEGNFELLRSEVSKLLIDFEDFKGSALGDEDSRERENMVKCFLAYMWILRIHTAVDRYSPLLSVMDNIIAFSEGIDKTNEFQESNI